ncbi:hypothetical protein EAE96_007759 [Botrytis aclada]|nr:hypothetical protein EAE96_007759 [Botrytis aclada]
MSDPFNVLLSWFLTALAIASLMPYLASGFPIPQYITSARDTAQNAMSTRIGNFLHDEKIVGQATFDEELDCLVAEQ